ncbi:MAG: molecular chaperone TorD family protein, partial [Chloroflexi bacterium]|nr:molecular chaperone TorD family protein [Chloroflexota bacterium]
MLDRRSEAEARSIVYRLLSRAFLEVPTVLFLRGLSEPATLRVFSRIGGRWLASLLDRDLGALAEEMGPEYTRLFVGPGFHAYPYESMYTGAPDSGRWGAENLLNGEAATNVEEFYRQIGLATGPSFRWLPDHIGV